jgi:hypothetical protein
VTRALLWLVAGLVVFVGAVLVTAPELLSADEDQLAGLVGVAVVAAVPGVVLLGLAVLAIRKRRRRGEPDPADVGRPPASRDPRP